MFLIFNLQILWNVKFCDILTAFDYLKIYGMQTLYTFALKAIKCVSKKIDQKLSKLEARICFQSFCVSTWNLKHNLLTAPKSFSF